jgi:hypothetical protein
VNGTPAVTGAGRDVTVSRVAVVPPTSNAVVAVAARPPTVAVRV